MSCRFPIVFMAIATSFAFAAFAGPARACAVCATADPTLTPPESGSAFRNRLLTTLDVREGSASAGGVRVDDRRLELAATYAPTATLLMTLAVPALYRGISTGAGTGQSATDIDRASLGDVELRVRTVRSRTLAGGARQRFGVLAVLKGPTAPLQADGTGALLPSVLQPGCSSIVPAAGMDYAIAHGQWSGYGSISLWLPIPVRAAPHAGDSLRAGARVQWQPLHVLALRAGPSVRLDTAGELAGGGTDPNSGGLIAYAAGELVASLATDFVVEVGALYPALQLLRGDHHEGPIAMASLSYDF
jgi:hypothetical protein